MTYPRLCVILTNHTLGAGRAISRLLWCYGVSQPRTEDRGGEPRGQLPYSPSSAIPKPHKAVETSVQHAGPPGCPTGAQWSPRGRRPSSLCVITGTLTSATNSLPASGPWVSSLAGQANGHGETQELRANPHGENGHPGLLPNGPFDQDPASHTSTCSERARSSDRSDVARALCAHGSYSVADLHPSSLLPSLMAIASATTSPYFLDAA